MIQRALVTDGKESATLAVVKSLGKKGIAVTVGDDSRFAPSRFSKYCSRFFLYPSPETDAEGYAQKLLDELKTSRAGMLFLTSDTQMPVVMKYWNDISKHTRIAAPPPETLNKVFNKSKTLELAKSLSVPIPKTIQVTSLADFDARKTDFNFPVVVKCTQTYFWKGNKLAASPRVQYAYSKDELKSKLLSANLAGQSILLQELVTGPGIGLFGIFQNGNPRILFSHERLREANPTGGASAEAKSIPVTKEGRDIAVALMKALNWTGAAMIEFKKDLRTGKLTLMEINGRFWGSLPLAIRCGVDFPVLLAQMMETGKPPLEIEYPSGIRCRHLNRYLTHLFHALKGKPRGWDGLFPGRLETLVDLLKFRQKNLFYYGLEWADPLPEIADLAFWAQSNLVKIFRRLRPA